MINKPLRFKVGDRVKIRKDFEAICRMETKEKGIYFGCIFSKSDAGQTGTVIDLEDGDTYDYRVRPDMGDPSYFRETWLTRKFKLIL